jgi:hypothetical protein
LWWRVCGGSGVVEKEKWDGEFTEAAVDALADSISEPKLDLPLATDGDATVLAFPKDAASRTGSSDLSEPGPVTSVRDHGQNGGQMKGVRLSPD